MKEKIIKKYLKNIIKFSMILFIVLLLIEIILLFINKSCVVLIWIPLIPLLFIATKVLFIKNAEICYGKVIDVILNTDIDDVCMSTNIQCEINNKLYQFNYYEHWGDHIEDQKEEINKFYENGRKRINKQVPILYKKNNPDKHIVFIEEII